MAIQASDELRRHAKILAEWGKNLPIRRIYIFGSRARGDARRDSDLDVAIEFEGDPSRGATPDAMKNWQHQNETDFSELKRMLGVKLELHADAGDDAWPAIRKGAKTPSLVLGKVVCVATPRRQVVG